MKKEAERIYLDGVWISIGGNTPWGIEGRIVNITLYEIDPRNFNGNGNSIIKIKFDSGYTLKVKTNDYMILINE